MEKPEQGEKGMYAEGSLWRKWDLHVHSPLSILNNQFPMLPDGTPNWEEYIKRLEASGLAVLAITDYFTIEGYKKILEYRKQGRLQGVDLVIPNIEFRLDVFVGKDAKRVNFHVLFSDAVTPEDIEDHFLGELKFVYEKDPFGPDKSKSLKLANLRALGDKLLGEQPDLQGNSPLTVGANQAAISLQSIVECLRRQPDRFDGKYLLVLADESLSKMAWPGQDHATRKHLLQSCQMVFTSNSKAREFLLGQAPAYPDGQGKFVEEFGSLKPAIWGSDAHKLEELGNPCAKRGEKGHQCTMDAKDCDPRFTWVKADPTFEGLKQLLCEPEDRVIVAGQPPSRTQSSFTLSEFHIDAANISSSLAIQKTVLSLNPGLVVITGGKGSGKTALADLLANCFQPRATSKDPNSFVRRIASSKPQFKTGFTTIGGDVFEKSVLAPTVFDKTEIVYIPQGELDSRISEGSDFARYVHSLVFDNERVRNTKQVFEFGELEKKARSLSESIARTARTISELERATGASVDADLRRQIELAKSSADDIAKRIDEIAAKDGKGMEELLRADEEITKRIDQLKETLTEIETIRKLSADMVKFVVDDLPRVQKTIAELSRLGAKHGFDIPLAAVVAPARDAFDQFDLKARGRLAEIVSSIETEQKKLRGHTDTRQRHTQLLAAKSDAAKKLAQLTRDELDLQKKTQDLLQLRGEARELYRNLLKTKATIRSLYTTIIVEFLTHRESILKDLSFRVHVRFNRAAVEARAEELFDNREYRPRDLDPLLEAMQNVANFEGPMDSQAYLDLVAALGAELDKAEALRPKLKSAFADDSSKFYQLLLGDHFEVEPIVEYKGAEVSKLSLGQKATVLVKIHLAQGDRPIIIDSHDDHLDNEFIMDELIGALRSAKQHRQVILASNNGNVVVNSDADQVILSKIDGQTISYSSGSLENPDIRARALMVLEGGADAFKRRQDKYRLGRIH